MCKTLSLPQWVPNIILRHHAGVPLMAEHIRHIGFSFWVKHLSFCSWSPLWSALLETPKKISTTSTLLFPYIKRHFLNHNCLADFLVPFNFPTPSTTSDIQFYLADFSFQCTDLDDKSTFTLFSDFLQILPGSYQIIATDVSKSAHTMSIAACSETNHLPYRVHNIKLVFTAEALAIYIALDELVSHSIPLLILTDTSLL